MVEISAKNLQTQSSAVTIATLNINGLPSVYHVKGSKEVLLSRRIRHQAICEWFEKSDVDIINFQEVFTYRNLRLLRKCLPSYPHVSFRPFLFGPRGALVTFSKIPLSVVSYRSYRSAAMKVDRSKLPKFSSLRSALKGIIVLRAATVPLTIINTHVLANFDFDWSASGTFYAMQAAQLDQLADVIKTQTSALPDAGLVVTGDFNVPQDSRLCKDFLATCTLRDVFATDNVSTFHNEFLATDKNVPRIDYVLINNGSGVRVTGSRRIFTQRTRIHNRGEVFLSDHQGLSASVRLPAPAR